MADGSPPALLSTKPKKSYELTACSISYAKPTSAITTLRNLVFAPCTPPAFILRDVSFTARPAEILAVVGPSGAGKSTLLDILAARTSPTAGRLLLNSSPLHAVTFRKLSAHVPQHDAALPQLTVAETFAFAAALLLPDPSVAPAAVSALLADLRLSHLAHTRLSGRLSGGERRRVSIGLSLLHDPAVLLLDEPTSGLDSASAYTVMQVLRSVAASRHATVVLSIHQPSAKILATIDALLLLADGAVVHHGDLASLDAFLLASGFTVPPQLNALEYAMEVLPELPAAEAAGKEPSLVSPPPLRAEVRRGSSRAHEIFTLYRRSWKIVYRTKQLLLTNAAEALGVGFLLGTIYINAGYGEEGMRKRLGLFAFTLTFLLSSTTETLPIFVGERPILLREAAAGVYRLSSHLIAATLVFIPYLLGVALLYAAAVYFLVGLCAKWQAFVGFVVAVWAVVLAANSFVLFVSAVSPDYIAGTAVVNLALAGFFLFSGYFISRGSMPGYWLFAHYLSPYKYALDAMLANEYGCAAGRCFECGSGEGGACAVTGRDVLRERGLREGQQWESVQVLLGFFVLYRVLYWAVLSRRAASSKR